MADWYHSLPPRGPGSDLCVTTARLLKSPPGGAGGGSNSSSHIRRQEVAGKDSQQDVRPVICQYDYSKRSSGPASPIPVRRSMVSWPTLEGARISFAALFTKSPSCLISKWSTSFADHRCTPQQPLKLIVCTQRSWLHPPCPWTKMSTAQLYWHFTLLKW